VFDPALVVQDTCEPEEPKKAVAGMSRRVAAVVAPTVPEMSVVLPEFTAKRFRIWNRMGSERERDKR
jgi:hypothetical protein